MTQEQLRQFELVAPLVETGKLPVAIAARMLTISTRQLERYLQGQGVTTKKAWNRINEDMRQEITVLKQENPNFNCQWISELISDRHEQSVSQSSVWRILKKANLLNTFVDTPIVRSRFEAKGSGDIIQLDTSWGYWINDERLNLILLLDDHSRYIVAAEFFWEDSAYNNMQMIRDVVEDYGTFRLLYTDNASFLNPFATTTASTKPTARKNTKARLPGP
jgi:hypothetical protein